MEASGTAATLRHLLVPEGAAAARRTRERSSVRIIIADDQRHTRSGLKALLLASLPAVDIWEAATGLEAVRLSEEVRPDLVLMDIRMPDLDGLSATRRVKANQRNVKVLVLSLVGSAAADAREAGADAFVSKGESPDRLLGVIAALIGPSDPAGFPPS